MQYWSLLLAVFGAGAAVIHQALSIRLPAELVIAQPVAVLHRAIRLYTIRNSLWWLLGLMVFPLAIFVLLEMTPNVLPRTSFALQPNWEYYWIWLASWAAYALLLAALIQWQILRWRARPFIWHLGVYAGYAVGVQVVWFFLCSGSTSGIVVLGSMLVAAVFLWLVTRASAANFSEAITA